MLFQPPRVVTLDIGRANQHQTPGSEPLCFAEQLSIIDEIADLGIEQTRLLLHDRNEFESLVRLTEYAERRRCAVTAVLRTEVDEPLIREIGALRPKAIALPLHSHNAAVHQTIAASLDWSRSIHLAAVIRHAGAALEIESTITSENIVPLKPLYEIVEALRASSWRLDFSGSSLSEGLRSAAATAIARIASSGQTRVTVHDLSSLRKAQPRPQPGLGPSPLPLTMTASVDSMHLTWFGDVRTGEAAVPIAGNVRVQTLAAIHELSPEYTALRRKAARRHTAPRARERTRPRVHV